MLNNIFTIAIFLIVFVCIMSPWVLNKIKTRKSVHSYSDPGSAMDMAVLDQPISFGYKCMWFAVKSDHPEKLIKTLNLINIKPCNWQTGIERAYDNSVYITPSIDGWTLACGWVLPDGGSKEGIDYIKNILQDLSRDYGEAQFFCTHRVTEYHCWINAVEGNIRRVYSYLGETGENIVIEGEATDFEKSLQLVNTFSAEAKDENYFERSDINLPDEETVMKVAENWSVNPSTLANRNDVKPGLGLLGEW
jgi:hypothetical protein